MLSTLFETEMTAELVLQGISYPLCNLLILRFFGVFSSLELALQTAVLATIA